MDDVLTSILHMGVIVTCGDAPRTEAAKMLIPTEKSAEIWRIRADRYERKCKSASVNSARQFERDHKENDRDGHQD